MDSWRVVQVGDWGTHPGASGKHTTPIAVIKGVGSMPLYVAAEVTDGHSSLILKLRVNELTGEWGVVALQLRDELHGEELTGKFLRTLPIAKLCNEATPMIYERFNYGDLFGAGQIKGLPDVPPEVIEQWPNGDKDLVFKWVSTIYEGALAANLPPQKP